MGGSGLRFDYTIQAGDTAASGITVISTIDPNGGTLADSAGNVAPLALSGAGALSGVVVDTTAPTLQAFTPSGDQTYGRGSVLALR